jgi:PAS domain S-box-containing protein
MNAATRKVVNLVYGLALALLAANALLAYLDIRAIVRGNWWVLHSREVVVQLEGAASTLKDAETGQRGYLLTGKDEYLKPYVDAANGLDRDLDRLFTLTSDNPDQQARLVELRRIAGEKIDELARTVALMRKGDRNAALTVVQTDRGKALMDRARALVAEMRDEEDRLLTQRSAAASNAAWRAVASVVVATTLVALSLWLVSHLKRREDAERDRAVEALRQSEEWLSRLMESIGDGVVATDGRGRVRLMNPVAQALTGWTQAEAVGRPLEEVFVILNEETRRPAENPVLRAVREGVVMGLANHTVLMARGGAETSIEDSAAPVKDATGNVVGVVMVSRTPPSGGGTRRPCGRARSGTGRSWRASRTPSSPWTGTGVSPTSTARPRRCWAGAVTTCSARAYGGSTRTRSAA